MERNQILYDLIGFVALTKSIPTYVADAQDLLVDLTGPLEIREMQELVLAAMPLIIHLQEALVEPLARVELLELRAMLGLKAIQVTHIFAVRIAEFVYRAMVALAELPAAVTVATLFRDFITESAAVVELELSTADLVALQMEVVVWAELAVEVRAETLLHRAKRQT